LGSSVQPLGIKNSEKNPFLTKHRNLLKPLGCILTTIVYNSS